MEEEEGERGRGGGERINYSTFGLTYGGNVLGRHSQKESFVTKSLTTSTVTHVLPDGVNNLKKCLSRHVHTQNKHRGGGSP